MRRMCKYCCLPMGYSVLLIFLYLSLHWGQFVSCTVRTYLIPSALIQVLGRPSHGLGLAVSRSQPGSAAQPVARASLQIVHLEQAAQGSCFKIFLTITSLPRMILFSYTKGIKIKYPLSLPGWKRQQPRRGFMSLCKRERGARGVKRRRGRRGRARGWGRMEKDL